MGNAPTWKLNSKFIEIFYAQYHLNQIIGTENTWWGINNHIERKHQDIEPKK